MAEEIRDPDLDPDSDPDFDPDIDGLLVLGPTPPVESFRIVAEDDRVGGLTRYMGEWGRLAVWIEVERDSDRGMILIGELDCYPSDMIHLYFDPRLPSAPFISGDCAVVRLRCRGRSGDESDRREGERSERSEDAIRNAVSTSIDMTTLSLMKSTKGIRRERVLTPIYHIALFNTAKPLIPFLSRLVRSICRRSSPWRGLK